MSEITYVKVGGSQNQLTMEKGTGKAFNQTSIGKAYYRSSLLCVCVSLVKNLLILSMWSRTMNNAEVKDTNPSTPCSPKSVCNF